MSAFWVTFSDGSKGCVEVKRAADMIQAAKIKAQELKLGLDVKEVRQLPYPAEPRLNRLAYGGHGAIPSFCHKPNQCAGRSSCPREIACDD